MNISSSRFFMQSYSNLKAGGKHNTKPNTGENQTPPTSPTDSVLLSTLSQNKANTELEFLSLPHAELTRPSNKDSSLQFYGATKFSRYAWNGTQTAEEKATGHKYYTAPGRITKETREALEAESNSLGKKISSALKKAGIELTADDKLNFSIDSDGNIAIDTKGLSPKTRKKTDDIESALNTIPGLAKELKLNSAGKMVNKRQNEADNAPAGAVGVAPAQYGDNDPAMAAAQALLMDDWLQSELGFGLDELAAEGAAEGWGDGSEYFQKLKEFALNGDFSWEEGHELINQVGGIISNQSKDSATSFSASFSFQNGELSDKKDAAKSTPKSGEKAAEAGNSDPVKTDEATATEPAEDKNTDINTAMTNFKDAFKAALGLQNQPFSLQLKNGMFSMSNAAFLSNNSRNAAIGIMNQLNNNTIDPQSDLSKSAQALRGLASGSTINF